MITATSNKEALKGELAKWFPKPVKIPRPIKTPPFENKAYRRSYAFKTRFFRRIGQSIVPRRNRRWLAEEKAWLAPPQLALVDNASSVGYLGGGRIITATAVTIPLSPREWRMLTGIKLRAAQSCFHQIRK